MGTKNLSLLGFLVAVGIASAISPKAFAGIDDSGGGTIIRFSQTSEPVLLDLFLKDSNFKDEIPGERVPLVCPGSSQNRNGFDYFTMNPHTHNAYQLAFQRLHAWEKNSPVIVGQLWSAMFTGWLKITYGELPQSDSYSVPADFNHKYPGATLETAAFYYPATGPVLSLRIWNSLGATSQAGIVIHEALREIQIGYGDQMSEKILQDTTARILLDEPLPGETLDDPSLYGPMLGNALQEYALGKRTDRWEDFGKVLKQFSQRRDGLRKAIETDQVLQNIVKTFKTNNECVETAH